VLVVRPFRDDRRDAVDHRAADGDVEVVAFPLFGARAREAEERGGRTGAADLFDDE
jgi:hypothetical protein